MSIVVPKAGRVLLADVLWRLNWSGGVPYRLRLFKNDYIPDINSGLVDLTEATFTGYAEKEILRGDNGASVLAGSVGRVLLGNAGQVWDCTGAPHTIFGWYLTNEDGDTLMLVERYQTPHVLSIGSRHTLFP